MLLGTATSFQVQFHALALLYELKKGDRLALHKVVTSMARNSLKSPMAECLLVSHLVIGKLLSQVEKLLSCHICYLTLCFFDPHMIKLCHFLILDHVPSLNISESQPRRRFCFRICHPDLDVGTRCHGGTDLDVLLGISSNLR